MAVCYPDSDMWRDPRCTQLEEDDVEMAPDFPSVQGRARVELIEVPADESARLAERVRSLTLGTGAAGGRARGIQRAG